MPNIPGSPDPPFITDFESTTEEDPVSGLMRVTVPCLLVTQTWSSGPHKTSQGRLIPDMRVVSVKVVEPT